MKQLWSVLNIIFSEGWIDFQHLYKVGLLYTLTQNLNEHYNAAMLDFCLNVTEHDLHLSVSEETARKSRSTSFSLALLFLFLFSLNLLWNCLLQKALYKQIAFEMKSASLPSHTNVIWTVMTWHSLLQ